MEVVLWQILQWVLRIILLLLLLIVVLMVIILIVPIRYRAEGSLLGKKPDIKGKVTWFFYLIYMSFCYEEKFRVQVRVFGFKFFDSMENEENPKKKLKKTASDMNSVTDFGNKICEGGKINTENKVSEAGKTNTENRVSEAEKNIISNVGSNGQEDELAAWEREIEAQAKEEAELAKKIIEQNQEEIVFVKEKKSFSEKIDAIKSKIGDIIQKIKDIIAKIKEGKLKVEHYLELWNRNETQITFHRAKIKFGKMIKVILPRKWIVTGEVGFNNPATTGQFMGVLGAMYPFLGNKVQIVPDFENEVIKLEGNVKGHIRLGNLLYQLVSLILNKHSFKFIKLVFDELGSSSKGKKKNQNLKENK